MSHIVTIQTKLHDPVAVRAACRRFKLDAPEQGTTRLFAGQATGLLVRLPDWRYPIVIDTLTGGVQYDNYAGTWGDTRELNRFVQAYAVEKARLEARERGYSTIETQLQDGSIRLQIVES